jgi:hypothetical protein
MQLKWNILKSAVLFATVAALAFMVSPEILAQQPKTLTGEVSDVMCAGVHGMPGMTAAECTRACAKQGGYALVVGKDVYTLKGHEAELDKYAAQRVTVTGAVNGKTVTVASVMPAKKG